MNGKWNLIAVGVVTTLSAQTNWWNQFNDSGIDSLIQQGLNGNKAIVASKERLKQSSEMTKLNRSQILPSIYGNGRIGRSDLNGYTLPAKVDYMSTGAVSLDARYVVSAWGKEFQQYRKIERGGTRSNRTGAID